jgi:ubiquinone/menaquinone biosynthesis C-methylase UbiE
MPTINENSDTWDSKYDWSNRGDEWSRAWGGPAAEWHGTILPRLHSWLPATTVLEIAPGFGRWTQYLRWHTNHLIVVDLSGKCIEACRIRFADASNITYHVNDGRSLAMVPDNSVDVAFSFDSLVHAEADAIEAYLRELARTLTADGVGFIHHSNIGAYSRRLALGRSLTPLHWRLARLSPRLARLGLVNVHWRAESMTAELFERLCRRAGLKCRSQEILPWHGPLFSDCISVFTPPASRWARDNVVVRNGSFMKEAAHVASLEGLYTRSSRRMTCGPGAGLGREGSC